ncbi:MAG: hypothetical protein AB8H80_07555 [Planctomycetota bacterium]
MDGRLTVLHERADGRLVAGGTFATIGGVETDRIAEWDGAGWRTLGGGLPTFPAVRDLAELSNGDLVAVAGFVGGGAADLQRFDDATWAAMSGITGRFNAVAALPVGEFLLAGSFQAPTASGPANNVAR